MVPRIRLHVPKAVKILQPSAVAVYQSYLAVSLKELIPQAKIVAQVETPVGATAELVKSVTDRWLPHLLTIQLEWILAYAPAVQYGSRPHWVPIGPLKLWVQKIKGTNDPAVAYKIRWAIFQHGTKPSRFLERARSKVKQYVVPVFRARMKLLAKLLSGDFGP